MTGETRHTHITHVHMRKRERRERRRFAVSPTYHCYHPQTGELGAARSWPPFRLRPSILLGKQLETGGRGGDVGDLPYRPTIPCVNGMVGFGFSRPGGRRGEAKPNSTAGCLSIFLVCPTCPSLSTYTTLSIVSHGSRDHMCILISTGWVVYGSGYFLFNFLLFSLRDTIRLGGKREPRGRSLSLFL